MPTAFGLSVFRRLRCVAPPPKDKHQQLCFSRRFENASSVSTCVVFFASSR
ncbi:hypothetical protein LMG31884_04040 [Xanthomonas hydrangeae]|nr:hypothetical protein LMG31884_04040 [Xanthomonas hydrangeae]CAD7713042.1 hypothetical protein LMG31884_04040 [Xanthomonas hydrangeae]CAD7718661.1 hypothetical protein LMG31887_04050 [Xanthomonas hydrangeae]CAD7718663.1 hypothetical protein LMG31887_04050 [Xanthomonas hydrangeae]